MSLLAFVSSCFLHNRNESALLLSMFSAPQVVPDRAAPPPGQFCGQAFGADAPSVVL